MQLASAEVDDARVQGVTFTKPSGKVDSQPAPEFIGFTLWL